MDFHSLLRRDLQFLCKRNKIAANMTNLAMADALKSLETVEGLDEYMNQSHSNVLQSPASVAKLPPSTATRTTRRKTAMKAEPQLVNRLMSKSLDGEMDQENVKIEASVVKTPAARSTRKASAAAATCGSKVQESKKGDLVQPAYSTRRSTRLLEKCMADLSLITKETEQKVSAKEKNPAGSEERSEDLSASIEKEWEMLENDSDQVLEISVEKTETMEVMSDEKESENSLVQEDKQEETLQTNEAVCEEGDNDPETTDFENCVDLVEIPVLEHANSETNNDNKESKDIQAFESLGQVNHLEIEQAIQENDSETEKVNTFHEETVVDQPDIDSETEPEEDNSDSTISEADSNQAEQQETEHVRPENDSETVKTNTFDEDTMVDQTDSETEPEQNDSGVDSNGTVSEADSNQAVQGSDIAEEEMILSESEGPVTAPASPSLLLEEAKAKAAPLSPFSAESISALFPRPNKSAATTPSKNSAMKLLISADNNNNKENNMEMMVNVSDNGESKGEAKKQKKKVEFDEENLKDVSMRQLVKMVKELSIKSSNNRTALQMLPGNNQIAE